MKHVDNPADPSVDNLENEVAHLDREQAFLLYATFAGDVMRTAHSLNVSPAAILNMADEGGWADRLKGVIELKKSGRPGDWERAINRALNYVQVHRLRLTIERALNRIAGMEDDEFEKVLTEERLDKEGNVMSRKLSGKGISDLTAALEKVHDMTYKALSDTNTDRGRRKEGEDDSGTVTDLHAKIASKMHDVMGDSSPRAQLFDAQMVQGEVVLEEAKRKELESKARKERVTKRWSTVVEAAKDEFNKDPRMLDIKSRRVQKRAGVPLPPESGDGDAG